MSIESQRLGKYQLRERLASGGQGEVWKAFDEQLRRFVAIKRLNAHLQDDPGSAARFEREAQFIASLRHPNVVQIHEFVRAPGSDTSTAYMVMDYIDGPTLAAYIRDTSYKKRFPEASDVVSIFTGVSLALDYAHQRGMIHRDIKPANIMLDKRNPHGKPIGEPILMDFGIAKLQGGTADTTRVLGTPLYVSPEQAQGLPGDKRSDLYSLGIVLYEVMAGHPPFHSEVVFAILRQHYEDNPPPPTRFNPDISPELSSVILKSISKDPDARFSSASAMTIALAEALNVPVPPELWKAQAGTRVGTSPTPTGKAQVGTSPSPTGMVSEADVSSLLSLPSGTTPNLPLTPSLPESSVGASPLAFVPPASNPTLLSSGSGSAVYSLSGVNNSVSPAQIPSLPPPGPQPSAKRPKKRLLVALIVLLAVLGLGLVSYALLVPKTPPAVGQVHFLSSKNIAGDFDEVQITALQGIPDGNSYYAWLETHNFSGFFVHWSFTVRNGGLSPSFYIDPQNSNLLTSVPPPYLFLITRQSESTQVPSFNPTDRLYYARLDSDHSTFDIMPCPQSASDNICMS